MSAVSPRALARVVVLTGAALQSGGGCHDRLSIVPAAPGAATLTSSAVIHNHRHSILWGALEFCVRHKAVPLLLPGAIKSGAFGTNFLPSTVECPTNVTVFTPSHAVTHRAPNWSEDQGDRQTIDVDQPVVLKVRLRVPTGSWASLETSPGGTGYTASEWAAMTVIRANTLLSDNRAGLTVEVNTPVEYAPGAVGEFNSSCSNIGILQTAGLYEADRINIYYAFRIEPYNSKMGFNCWEQGFPNVIFVSLSHEIGPILTHELGHALGLRGAVYPSGVGHVGAAPFTERNLMWATAVGWKARAQDTLTLGQVFRMSLDDLSWINLTLSGPLRSGLVKSCGLPPAAGSCPALELFWP